MSEMRTDYLTFLELAVMGKEQLFLAGLSLNIHPVQGVCARFSGGIIKDQAIHQ